MHYGSFPFAVNFSPLLYRAPVMLTVTTKCGGARGAGEKAGVAVWQKVTSCHCYVHYVADGSSVFVLKTFRVHFCPTLSLFLRGINYVLPVRREGLVAETYCLTSSVINCPRASGWQGLQPPYTCIIMWLHQYDAIIYCKVLFSLLLAPFLAS